MEFIKPDINIDFVGKRKIAFAVSALLILVSVVSLVMHGGPRYGVDFAGGTEIQVKFSNSVTVDAIKDGLKAIGMENAKVQRFGEKKDNEFLVHADDSIAANRDFTTQLAKALKDGTQVDAEIRRLEMVGPQVGKDLREKALFAMFYVLMLITIYISGRFESGWMKSLGVAGALIAVVYAFTLFHMGMPLLILVALMVSLALFAYVKLKYALGAIIALIHDVTITVGAFSLFDKEFSLPIIAALLTIIGYSLNDTIIVFDRIRENLRKHTKQPLDQLINRSVNETLSRTILTSGTTLLVVLALFVLGGGIIHDFSFALLVGIVVGTYSSVYVASPVLLVFEGFGRRK